MIRNKIRSSVALASLAGVALAWSGSGSAVRADDTAVRQELAEQIRQLQEKVNHLESRQNDQAQKVDSALIDKSVADVMADSEKRSQLLQAQGFTAGYSNGKFLIQSEDGKFTLNPNVQLQFRYAADFRDNSKNGSAKQDDSQAGFEARRLKFSLDGNLFTKNFTYKFQWATSRSNGQLQLDEGWVKYAIEGTPFAVRLGTFLNGWDHETAIGSKKQVAVERSVLHEIFSNGATSSENYVQGIEVSYDDGGPLRASLNYNDGFSSRNTNFQDGGGGSAAIGLVSPTGAISGRVEYKLSGDWKSYEDFTALGTKTDLLVIGGGFDVEFADNLTAYFHTIDVAWEPASIKGLSLYGAYVGLYRDFRTVGAGIEDKPYDWGFLAQASYLLNDQWEVFGRYSYTSLDDKAPTGTGTFGAAARVNDNISEITVGVNYYLKGHAAKFTLDATYLPTGSPIDLNGANILSQPNDSAQFLFRGQFQLLL